MNKLFNSTQTKGKWHKFISFDLGRGAKLYKNFARKLLAVSLCMAVVLLGVPRGQNFVAEAADEATKSVALLTLTLTGDKDDPLEAKMEWKSFVQGTTVGLEVVFVDEGGNASGPSDYGTWLDTFGNLDGGDDGFEPFAPADWLKEVPSTYFLHELGGDDWTHYFLSVAQSVLSSVDWFPALPLGHESAPFSLCPGLARVRAGFSLPVGSDYLALAKSFLGFLFPSNAAVSGAVTPPDIASFDGTSLFGLSPGTASLLLSLSPLNFSLGSLSVQVVRPVDSVSLSVPAKPLRVGDAFDLTATVSPADATNKNVTWTSSDAAVASVSGDGLTGTVQALKAGTTTITVTTEDGDHTATCDVTVTQPVTGVSLSATTKTLTVGETFDLTATIAPDDATSKNVTWTSSDATVASVDENGTVKALKAGTTTITVTTADGAKTATCEVTVKESSLAGFFTALPAALTGLTFNDTSQTLISAGTLKAAFSGCHVEYAVAEVCPAEDSAFWSPSLPMGTGAGTYKVWYRVVDSSSKVLRVSEEPISVTIAPRSLADADIWVAGGPHYYTGSEVTPAVSVSLTGFGLLTDGTDYVVSYSNNTNAGTATVTIKGKGNFTGTVNKTFTITKATPDSSGLTTSLDAFYGQTLSELLGRLAKPKDLKGNTLEGSWSWADKDGKPLSDDTKVGSVGEHTYTAVFTPNDSNYSTVEITVTVKVSVDTSKWGDAHERPGDKKTQYVDQAGKTSIEVKVDNLSAGSVLWLFEESYGTSAWYGLDLSADAFALDKGLRFYVQWVSPDDAEYNTYYSQLDDAQKTRVEGDNGWIFLIGIEDPEGNKVQPAQPVNVYVQLGKDWDPEHLNAYYISAGADVGVPIKNLILYFPGGSGIFGCMTLAHFSPYFIFDELTDEEKAALWRESSGLKNNVTTGDLATQITVAGLGMTLVLALGIMLKLITSKRKFEK